MARPTQQTDRTAPSSSVGVYDVTLASLRMMIFSIEETSAAMIANVIRSELNDNGIIDLLNNKGELRKKMVQARLKHAENLRNTGKVDVDVIYETDRYRIEPFKRDKDKMSKLGAQVYHVYPFRKTEKEMAFSALTTTSDIDQVYTRDHCVNFGIRIKTNTAAAPRTSNSGSTVPRPNSIFPHETRGEPLSQMEMVDRLLKNAEDRNREIRASAGSRRNRTDSLTQVRPAPKGPWHPFNSQFRGDQQQPAWDEHNHAFRGDPGIEGNDQWWMDDHATRQGTINEWKARTWKRRWGPGFGTIVMGDADPEFAVAGVDFQLVPPMCGTYTAAVQGCDSLERPICNRIRREYKTAAKAHEDFLPQLQNFYKCYTALTLDVKLKASDPTKWQRQMQEAKCQELALRTEFRSRGEFLQQKAKGSKENVDLTQFEVAGVLEKKMKNAVSAGLKQRGMSPLMKDFLPEALIAEMAGTPMPGSLPRPVLLQFDSGPCSRYDRLPKGRPRRFNPRSVPRNAREQLPSSKVPAVVNTGHGAPAEPIMSPPNCPESEWQTIASRDEKTISFPTYEDPMTSRAADIAATQQDIRRPAGLSRRTRTNTASALATILEDTGAKTSERRVESAWMGSANPSVPLLTQGIQAAAKRRADGGGSEMSLLR